MFSEYRIESKAANQISVEIHLGSIEHALRSVSKARAVSLRLTKKSGPCITFEAEVCSCLFCKSINNFPCSFLF
jgi:hypothetical protein